MTDRETLELFKELVKMAKTAFQRIAALEALVASLSDPEAGAVASLNTEVAALKDEVATLTANLGTPDDTADDAGSAAPSTVQLDPATGQPIVPAAA